MAVSHGRRVRDEADAQACLAAVAASGLSRRDWAHRHGIQARSLQAWRLILERKAGASSTAPVVRLVELLARRASTAAVYRVHVGHVSIEVDADFDPEVLRRLVRTLATC